jgi:hypothetical protein
MSIKSAVIALPMILLSVPVLAGDASQAMHAVIDLPVCNSHEEYDAYKKAVKERDRETFMKLRRANACDTVVKGSAVKIIGANGTTHSKIEYQGKTGTSVGWTTYLKTE